MIARCGTPSGYDKHLRLGEPTCQACREAESLRYRMWREANPSAKDRSRRQAAAYNQAERRLREMFPAEFAMLYAEERRHARTADR